MSGSTVAVMQSLKSSLFVDPAQPPVASAVASAAARRSAAALAEARNGMALAVSYIAVSPVSSSPSGNASASVEGADGLRSDLQNNSHVRQMMLLDLILAGQLLNAQTARNQTRMALRISRAMPPPQSR
jgi:hypothetical protein